MNNLDAESLKCLIVLHSYHHKNTAKIAEAISRVINAEVIGTDENSKEPIGSYDLIGFGSGIDSGKHYQPLLNFATQLSVLENQKCFIFSTSAIQSVKKVRSDHSALRTLLCEKGFIVIDEFSCKGFNTNSFLKFFGGMNKGRPNGEDLMRAKEFALDLQLKMKSFE